MQSNTMGFAGCCEQNRELDLQRIALLTAISVVSKRLAGRLVRMESQATEKKGGYSHDTGQSVKSCKRC